MSRGVQEMAVESGFTTNLRLCVRTAVSQNLVWRCGREGLAMRTNRLSALAVARAKAPGMYADGGGLYLRVDGASRAWVHRYKVRGKSHYMGLGSLEFVSLAEARQKVAEGRRLLWAGKDPIAHRDAERAAQRVLEAKA